MRNIGKKLVMLLVVISLTAGLTIPAIAADESATEFSGTSASQLNAALAQGDVVLTTPGSGGYGIAAGTTLVVPAGRTLYVSSILNIRRDATLRIEGTVVVLESGRLNSDGHATAATGTLVVATGGTLINYGYVEIAQRSTLTNLGTITNHNRFEIRIGVVFARGLVNGTRPLTIHRDVPSSGVWTLTYNKDNGTPITSVNFVAGTPVNQLIPAEAPVKDGFVFLGWKLVFGGTEVNVDITSVFPLNYHNLLQARWAEIAD